MYEWKLDDTRVALSAAQFRKVRPRFREFCHKKLSVQSYSLEPVDKERFEITYPPKTVITDSTGDFDRFFIKSENGVEREVLYNERTTAGPGGWSVIVGRDEAPVIDPDAGRFRWLFAAVFCVMLLVGAIVWIKRYFRGSLSNS
jgi:hypothetical protein